MTALMSQSLTLNLSFEESLTEQSILIDPESSNDTSFSALDFWLLFENKLFFTQINQLLTLDTATLNTKKALYFERAERSPPVIQ